MIMYAAEVIQWHADNPEDSSHKWYKNCLSDAFHLLIVEMRGLPRLDSSAFMARQDASWLSLHVKH